MLTGTIKLLVDARGYGFIATPEGRDVFFAHADVPGHGFRKLAIGQAVEFDLVLHSDRSNKGPRAKKVKPFSQEPEA